MDIDQPEWWTVRPGSQAPTSAPRRSRRTGSRLREKERESSAHARAAPGRGLQRAEPAVPLSEGREKRAARELRLWAGRGGAWRGGVLPSRAAPPPRPPSISGRRQPLPFGPSRLAGPAAPRFSGDHGGPQQAGHTDHLQAPPLGAHQQGNGPRACSGLLDIRAEPRGRPPLRQWPRPREEEPGRPVTRRTCGRGAWASPGSGPRAAPSLSEEWGTGRTRGSRAGRAPGGPGSARRQHLGAPGAGGTHFWFLTLGGQAHTGAAFGGGRVDPVSPERAGGGLGDPPPQRTGVHTQGLL